MKGNSQDKLALSPAEAAKMLGIGLNKMYDMVHIAGFPVIRVGRKLLIPTEQLKQWLAAHAGKQESF